MIELSKMFLNSFISLSWLILFFKTFKLLLMGLLKCVDITLPLLFYICYCIFYRLFWIICYTLNRVFYGLLCFFNCILIKGFLENGSDRRPFIFFIIRIFQIGRASCRERVKLWVCA